MARPSKKGAKSEAEVAAEAKRKKEILDQVAQSNLPTKTILKELGISRSTYYSWLKRYEEEGEKGLLDSRSLPKAEEEVKVATPAVEALEPQVAAVESVRDAVEETPPEPVAETVAAAGPTPPVRAGAVVTPEKPGATPVKQEPERREDVVSPSQTPPFTTAGEKKRGLGIYALIAILLLVLGLLFSVSISHYNSYQLRQTGDTLTLWKGKFAARGFEMVESFEPLEVGDSDVSTLTNRTFTKKNDVNRAIYAFLMDQISAEMAKGDQADNAKIGLLLAKAEDTVGSNAEGDRGLAEIRYQLAEKRVDLAEIELLEAYQKALPAYEEAARMGLGDVAILEAKIKTMQEALRGGSEEPVEAAPAEEAEASAAAVEPAAAAESGVEPEAAGEAAATAATPEEPAKEGVTPAAPEKPAAEAEVSAAPETLGLEAESPVKPAATPGATETIAAPTE